MTFSSTIQTKTVVPLGPELEDLVRAEYERTHGGDTFDALRARARFDKHDKGQLLLWLAIAAERWREGAL